MELAPKSAHVVQASHGAHWSRPEAVAKVLVEAAGEECPMTPFQIAVVQAGPDRVARRNDARPHPP